VRKILPIDAVSIP